MNRTYSNDELIKLMDTLPLPVQEAIESKTTVHTISEIGTRLRLHVDVLGKFAEMVRNMLFGLISPQEFQTELAAAGIPEAQTKQILTEINEKIFMPLQQKMRGGSQQATVANQKKPQTPEQVRPQILTQPQQPRSNMQQPPQARPIPPIQQPPIKRVEPPANLPGVMAGEKLLSDHEEPHIEVGTRGQMPEQPKLQMQQPPRPTLPIQPVQRPPAPLPTQTPTNPPAVPEQMPSKPTPPPSLKSFSNPAPPPPPQKPIAKYSVDPYREPFTDK